MSTHVYPTAWQHRTGAAPSLTGVRGRTYCFSVRARDNFGNTSTYSPEKCTTAPLDDRSLAASPGDWTRASSPNAYEGTVTRTRTYGATLTLRGARAAHVAVLVTTCATCGRVGVYLNGNLLKTVSTYSAVTRHRVLLIQPGFSYRKATITLKLTQRSRALIVDGLAITRR